MEWDARLKVARTINSVGNEEKFQKLVEQWKGKGFNGRKLRREGSQPVMLEG